jgi:SAM-dependent methyltransferase
MFRLSEADYALGVLDCGGGPASFAAEWSAQGRRVIAVDPLYAHSPRAIRSRFEATSASIMGSVRANPERWIWKFHASPDELLSRRTEALNRFLEDFDSAKSSGRYRVASLPHLPFPDQHFDLALVSHLLFLYSDLLDADFHRASIHELLRVAAEVRIFPLLTLAGTPSPYIEPLIADLRRDGWRCDLLPVDYELQPGGNTLLRIQRTPHSP